MLYAFKYIKIQAKTEKMHCKCIAENNF